MRRKRMWQRQAFTLVELLVVIGVIGVLIAILLPVLSAARRSAQTTKCAANLHQIMVAAQSIAQKKKGYFPLDSEITIDPQHMAPGHLGRGLNDSAKVKYAYSFNGALPTNESPDPFFICIVREFFGDWKSLEPNLNWHEYRAQNPAVRIIDCPAVSDDSAYDSGSYSMQLNGYAITGSTTSSYELNGGFFGFDFKLKNCRYGGFVKRAYRPSEMVALGDGKVFPVKKSWLPALDPNLQSMTLQDVFDQTPALSPNTSRGRRSFDMDIHKGKMNIAFMDGHVELRIISSDGLKDCYLLQKK